MIDAEKQASEMFKTAVKDIAKQLNDALRRNHAASEARFAPLESQIADLEGELSAKQKAWHELARQISVKQREN